MDEQVVNVEFRDGERMVPYYVSMLMKGLDTRTMLYGEAIRVANHKLMQDNLRRAQRDLVAEHFRKLG
jgi:hypothetical protein